MSLSDLLVTRTHTVQQGDPPRGTAVMTPDTAFVHHPFDVDRGEDIVVNAVTVLLLDAGIEQFETGGDDHRLGANVAAVRQPYMVRSHFARLATGHHLDTCRPDFIHQPVEDLMSRREGREQLVPAAQFST